MSGNNEQYPNREGLQTSLDLLASEWQYDEEARIFAENALSKFKKGELTGRYRGRGNEEQVHHRFHQEELALQNSFEQIYSINNGKVLFGLEQNIEDLLYFSILAGYNPTTKQQKLRSQQRSDFIQEELRDLHQNHPEVWAIMQDNGYIYEEDSYHFPNGSVSVQLLAIDEETVLNIIGYAYTKGIEYQELGYGFPLFSDVSKKDSERIEL